MYNETIQDIITLMRNKTKDLVYIEVMDISIVNIDEYIEYDMHDYYNNNEEFERDIESLLKYLKKELPEDIKFFYKYSEKYDISGIDGEKIPDYHCYIKFWEDI